MRLAPGTWGKRVVIVLAALIAGTVITAPFYFSHKEVSGAGHALRMSSTHDMAQHLAVMEQFNKVLESGVLYPRWLPDVNRGYGLPWTNFYPPGFYYLASLVHAVVNDWVIALFAISALSLTASGLALYLLSRQFYGALASAVAAMVYMIAPYHIVDLYWRGAMPEFTGFVLVPLIIYFALKVGRRGRMRDYAGLGLFHGLFLITHIPVAFLMTYTLGFYALVWSVKERDWTIGLRLVIGLVIALMLGGIYLVPAFFELKYASEHFSGIFPYHNSYITLLKGFDSFGDVMNVSFVAHVILLLTAVAILRPVLRKTGEQSTTRSPAGESPQAQARLWIIVGLATTFMCTSFSIYISKLIPKINIASFAWRWLVIASLFAALLFGAAVDRVLNNADLTRTRSWAYRTAIAAAIVFNFWITAQSVIAGALSGATLNPSPNFVEAGFIPKGSTDPQTLPDTPNVVVEPEGAAFEITRWDPQDREIHVRIDRPSKVRLRSYNFPGWTARIDGSVVPMSSDRDGVQQLEAPPGIHRIQVSFENTLPRTAGTVLSGLALAALFGLIVFDYVKSKRGDAQTA